MALQMKPACERCEAALSDQGEVFICSSECTFCRRCGAEMAFTCPNCRGELVRRPRRGAAISVA